jgi:hypothetical protein
MARFTSGGHGAAACVATWTLDVSYRARASSSSLSIRTNMVGTTCRWVMPKSWIAASAASASNRSIITTVPPTAWMVALNRSGAAW